MAGPFGIPTFENFDFSAYGKAGFGAEDLAYLQSQGASPYMINQVAQQAMSKGLNIGKVVQDYLVANPMVSANPFAPKPSSPAYSLTGTKQVQGVAPKKDVGSYTVPQTTYTFDPSKYKPTATAPAPAAETTSATPTTSAGPTTPTTKGKSMTAAEAILAGVDKMLAEMADQEAMSAAAAAQRADLQTQAARTLSANMARSQMMPNLQIQPATGVSKDAGTQGFKRRAAQFTPAQTILSGLNVGLPVTMNI